MTKNCAICLRGCIDKIQSGHFTTAESIYKNGTYINVDSIYESIKTHIIQTNPEYSFDFFIHCWNPDMETKMCKLYNPKSHLFENQNIYNDIVKISMDGQKLGVQKVLDLMIDYSEMNNMKYDKVIVYRPDVILFKDMDLNYYQDNHIYCNDTMTQDFHFIMNYNNATIFRNLNKYKLSFYNFSKDIMKNPINADYIKCGIHQEVLRKIRMASIDRHNVERQVFYKYGLTDAEIDLMTHM